MPLFTSEIYFAFFIIGIGLILVIAGLFSKKKNSIVAIDELGSVEKELRNVIEEAEEMIKEINEYSEYIIGEIEAKHKEILFLYQLIDEKEKKMKDLNSSSPNSYKKSGDSNNGQGISKEMPNSNFLSNPSSKQIIDLYSEGKSISEIARQLDIGKGEVQLVLGLAKMR